MKELKTSQNESNFNEWIISIKNKVKNSQLKAITHVNKEMLKLYWELGKEIVERKAESLWGSQFYMNLSFSLKQEFPDIKGFSVTNLKYMKKFYLFYNNEYENRQQPVDDLDFIYCIPWGHQILLISKCKNVDEALFYTKETLNKGWSRAILSNYLQSNLYEAKGKSITNFPKILPNPQSELAQETLKDPYNFDFITLTENYKEKELENALIHNITNLLLELGQGFAYLGRQIPIKVGNKDFYLDLLFYHLELRCYIVIELKVGEFDPSYIGQLGLYISAINHQIKKDFDNQTIGLLICKTKDNIVAEYTLESINHPIGISEYNLSSILPKEYQSSLPSVEEIEHSIKCMNNDIH